MATQALTPRRGTGAVALTLLLALFVVINYVDRGAIGIAAPSLRSELGLDHVQFGWAVAAFAWIYAPAQFFVGWLTGRMCVYRLVAAGLAIWALATFLTGFVGGVAALVAMRLLLGLGEGVAFPCAGKIIAAHVPPERRGLANSVVASAIALGPAAGTLFGGIILAHYGWRPIFWIFGALTLLWLIPWVMASKPHWTSRDTARAETPVSIWRIAAKRSAWTMGIAHFGNTYAYYFLLAWLPLYLIESRGMTVLAMTSIATSLYLTQALFAPFWGWLSDWMVARGGGEGRIRRSFMVAYQLCTALAVLATAYAPNTGSLAAALVFFGFVGGIGGTNPYAVSQIFAGRATGAFTGVMNGIGNTSGIFGPIITGMIIVAAGGDYHAAFLFTAAVALAGAIWWLVAIPRIEPDPELTNG